MRATPRLIGLALALGITLDAAAALAATQDRQSSTSGFNTGHSVGAEASQAVQTPGSPGSSGRQSRSRQPTVDHRAEYARLYEQMARRMVAEQAQRAAEHAHYESVQHTAERCEASARYYQSRAVRQEAYRVYAGFGRYVTLSRTVYNPAAAAQAAVYRRCADEARAALNSYAQQVATRRAAWDAQWAALNRQAHEHWRAFNTSCQTVGQQGTVATQLCSYDEWRNYSPGSFERDLRLGGPRPPVQLIDRARDEVTPPAPVIRLNPRVEWEQVVRVPTWMWIEPEAWTEQTARAEAGETWAEARAVPRQVIWDMGNGDRVVCSEPGTAYDPRRPSTSPSCSYTYPRSSAGQPGDRYAVTATLVYDATWTGSGESGGSLGQLSTSSTVRVRVAELQALNP